MSNRRKPQKPRKRKSGHSTLAHHKREGKVFKPPFMSMGAATSELPWWRDIYPDFVWICAAIHRLGERVGINAVTQVLDRLEPFVHVERPIADESEPSVQPHLTGSMTSFDLIPEPSRAAALAALQADNLYVEAFPWLLVRALSKYDDLPGSWILEGWAGSEQIVGTDEPEMFLREVTASASGGQTDVATVAKALWTRAFVKAGRIHFAQGLGITEFLPRYPLQLTAEERPLADASIRAMFGGMYGGMGHNGDGSPALVWARSFWRQNWRLYDCVTAEREASRDEADASAESRAAWAAQRDHWVSEIERIEANFHEAWRSADPDLYLPDRHEVLTGMTFRHVRAVDAMVRFPGFWTTEHGAPILRNLAEGRIVLRWLVKQAVDDNYQRFKNYGRGHLKLQVLHLREYRDGLEEEDSELDEQIEYLEHLLNRDRLEEFQDISIEGNFVKKNVRDMARETGLENEYRLLYAPMSADVHGEWAPLDRYVLSPCQNPLHRGHRIPNTDTTVMLGPDLVHTAVALVEALVEEFAAAMAPEGARSTEEAPKEAPGASTAT
ncbi:DUF5677 domain-containing protein [Propionibacteriaceae bacterium Y1923]